MKARVRFARANLELSLRRPRPRAHRLNTPLVVSVASYPPRYANLARTLKSLLRQTVRPDATILCVDEGDRAQLPSDVLALQAEGLTIRSGEGIRSYNKIIPALRAFPDSTIVTADDDVHYPADWLEGLVGVKEAEAEARVVCHRAHRVTLGPDGTPLPYRQWHWNIDGPDAGPLIVPTGVMGVLYAPGAFHPDVTRSDLFMKLCPNTDDIWLYWMFRMGGEQARKTPSMIPIYTWPGSQVTNLRRNNVRGNGNDHAIAALVSHYGFP
ncbi:glycosyltransferase [Falsirhodobacter sp. 20TX0035]|uniref:glycosyltransferase n=1 Tax=Falsirhodobacter sp. 20TX0035 TaxID=3022019 RepID=UPI00232EEE10|nr:glycosyltransferase [Falsirhodobacter sp. 20TX0035]MDB6454462.1 glycosyltransferase [Falsirhodobacter sp. 20TX0035]